MRLLFLLIIPITFLFAGCATSGQTTETEEVKLENVRPADSVSDDNNYTQNLADFLRRVPGVNVTGSANNQMVTVRGISSINSGIEPLFVIDGQTVGSDYNHVNSMLNVRDIDYVRVLKGSDAAIYGVRGGNGVIVIATRK